MKKLERIARICHEANRAYCQSIGDFNHLAWEDAPPHQRESCIKGVQFHLDHPDATPEDSHNEWFAHKKMQGWIWGEKKDEAKKTHPCMLPYAQLPQTERAKDYIFSGIVRAMSD